MKLAKLLPLFGFAGYAAASCENRCSGHGTCGDDHVCQCYQDWQMGDEDGGDCSDRTCPFEIAWVDRPQLNGHTHRYAECSNRGACDRSSGVCECFEGYTGSACQRTTCPNDCSGHGTCEFLSDLPYGEVVGDFGSMFNVSTTNEEITRQHGSYFGNWGGQDPLTFKDFGIPVWDQDKSRMCVCDAKWTDLDCSRRMCPKGNDVLDTRPDSDTAGFNYFYSPNSNAFNYYSVVDYQIQEIYLVAGGPLGDGLTGQVRIHDQSNFNNKHQAPVIAGGSNTAYMGSNVGTISSAMTSINDNAQAALVNDIVSSTARAHTFALTFTTNLNETYTTQPIELKSNVASTCFGVGTGTPTPSPSTYTCADANDADFIANALLALPNKVIDGVSVSTQVLSTNSVDATTGELTAWTPTTYKISVTFTGDAVQGKQNLLEVEDFMCLDGCTPKRSGLRLTSPDTDHYLNPYNEHIETSYVTELQAADWNVYECGRRGKCDYDTGLCECFEGFYGEACGYQSALV
jgi:hypothetical protein